MNPELSIVTTLYKSSSYIDEFLDRAVTAGEKIGAEFEIIVVDDGSPDDSRQKAEKRAQQDRRIRVIELSRNFGHHPALWCGMHYARGEFCFLIDCDLEVDPAVVDEFYRCLNNTGSDVVYGVQEIRQGAARTRVFGGMFWRMFGLLSDVKVPFDIMTERLMRRRYIDALLKMGDLNIFLGGMFYWPGFMQVPIKLKKRPRKGAVSYSLLDRFKLLVTAVSSFSSVPLAMIFWFGLCIFIMGASYSLYLLFRKILYSETLMSGFSFLAIVSVMGSAMTLMGLGVIGLYIHRIFKQVQGRPAFIVKNYYCADMLESDNQMSVELNQLQKKDI